jgi:glycosyltransferase involved in cell wall biosynthesis
MKSLSIVIPWCDRVELGQALPQMLKLAHCLDATVTIVNYAGSPGELARQTAGATGVGLIQIEGPSWFNKSRANNIGAAASGGEFLFFCDCDILLEEGQFRPLFEQVSSRPGTFGTLAGVKETQVNSRQAGNLVCFGYSLHLRTANGRALTIVDNEEDAVDGSRQAPGLLLVRREDFLAVGGYNGGFEGWGWEDQDMIARLTLAGGLERLQHGIARHISHDDAARTKRYACGAADRWESRDRIFRKALENYDMGRFEGTYREDAETYSRLHQVSELNDG